MAIRIIGFLIFLPLIAFGQWVRKVEFGTNWSDSPPPHNLAYFRLEPCMRTAVSERGLLAQCSPQTDAPEVGSARKRVARIRIVGSGGWYTVYEVGYFSDDDNSHADMRSVLIRSAPGEFREIHIGMNMVFGTLYPVKLLHANGQPVLKIAFDDGGIYHIRCEEYYVVLRTGPVELNFDAVYKAAETAAPSGRATYQPASYFDFDKMVFHIQTEDSNPNIGEKVACCEGRTRSRFRFKAPG